jgi:adenylate cyclase
MESHGLTGSIQVTDRVHSRLAQRFEFRERGVIDVKGKGPMRVFVLVGPKTVTATTPPMAVLSETEQV